MPMENNSDRRAGRPRPLTDAELNLVRGGAPADGTPWYLALPAPPPPDAGWRVEPSPPVIAPPI